MRAGQADKRLFRAAKGDAAPWIATAAGFLLDDPLKAVFAFNHAGLGAEDDYNPGIFVGRLRRFAVTGRHTRGDSTAAPSPCATASLGSIVTPVRIGDARAGIDEIHTFAPALKGSARKLANGTELK
jgi:hypothetical protein